MSPTSYRMDNRSRLIRAGAVLFHEQGFARTTVEDLLEETGIARSNFYYHFDDKFDLARAVVRRWIEGCERELANGVSDESADGLPIDDLFGLLLDEKAEDGSRNGGKKRGESSAIRPSQGALALELAPHDEEVRELLVGFLRDLEGRLKRALVDHSGGAREEFSDTHATAAARTAVATLEGALVLRRACRGSELPQEASDGLVELLEECVSG